MRRFARNHRLKPGPGTVRLDPDHFAGKPLLYYLLNQGGGTSASDLSAYANAGAIASNNQLNIWSWQRGGVSFAPYNQNTSLSFAPPVTSLPGLGTASMPDFSLWVKCGSIPSGITGLRHHAGVFGNQLIVSWSTTALTFFWDANYTQSMNVPAGPAGAAYLFVKRGTTATFYANGLPAVSFAVGDTIAGDDSQAKAVAFVSGSSLNNQAVQLDSVGLWPVGFTAAQAWQLYQRPYDMFIPSGARRGFVGATASGQTLAAGVASISVTEAAPGVSLGTASEQAGVANIAAAVSAPAVALGTATTPAGVAPIGAEVAPPPLALGPVAQAAGSASVSLAEVSPALQLGAIEPAAGIADLALAAAAPSIAFGVATAAAGDAEIGLQEIAPAVAGQAQPTNEVWQPRSRGTIWTLLE